MPQVQILKTARFSVLDRRYPWELRVNEFDKLRVVLQRHSFAIIKFTSTMKARQEALSSAMSTFFADTPSERKRSRVGAVYLSERGVPMFQLGYESQDGVRECFRVATSKISTGCCWPDDNKSTEHIWRAALTPLQRLAVTALRHLLSDRQDIDCVLRKEDEDDDDFSLAFSFCYDYQSQQSAHQDDSIRTRKDMFVDEHCDKSLVVVSPVADAPGLQVFDLQSKSWITIEDGARPHQDILLFAGLALEHATDGDIPACQHRVYRCDTSSHLHTTEHQKRSTRHSFIFELKLARFYSHLRHFGD